jgi:hypothetical protein
MLDMIVCGCLDNASLLITLRHVQLTKSASHWIPHWVWALSISVQILYVCIHLRNVQQNQDVLVPLLMPLALRRIDGP